MTALVLAGLRGVIGAGTNRMNIYTVRKATQGLANYIKKQGGERSYYLIQAIFHSFCLIHRLHSMIIRYLINFR